MRRAPGPSTTSRRAIRAGKGVEQHLLGTVKRKDGRRQVTYDGWPLYYYVGDTSPGAISCQNVSEYGGLWLVVSPDRPASSASLRAAMTAESAWRATISNKHG